jgi:hypothetical protein
MRTIAALLAAALLGAAPAGAAERDAEWRATMDEIFAAMQRVLPISLDDERFADPQEREAIRAALARLAANAGRLEQHAAGREAGLSHLSRSLARDARDIQRRFEAGKTPEARFLLHELTSTCVACHSRLPSDRRFPLGERFVDETVVAVLPLDERARYETATRQFDRALATHEALFADPQTSPADVSLLGYVDDYLEIAIRVKGDPPRARRTLETFAAREDLSPALRADVRSWIGSLRELEKRTPEAGALAEALALMDAAQDTQRFPDDRKALVYYVAASAVLHRLVASDAPDALERARAYYLLGVIESRVGRSLWLSQAEVYLESSIRLAPGAPFAPDAFELLSSVVLSGWTGSSGVHVPADVQDRLDELAGLLEAAQPAAAAP